MALAASHSRTAAAAGSSTQCHSRGVRPCAPHARQQWRRSAASALGSTSTSVSFPALAPLDANYEATHAFSDFANWLVPGSLLVGRYPYVEPSRCKSYDDGEKKLAEILAAGVTTFVSLQAEVPPQSEVPLAGVGGFMPYKAAADLIKHSMVGPPPMELMMGLRTPELDRFLPPRRKPASQAYDAYNNREKLDFSHNPITDLSVPTMTQLEEIVADLQRRVAAGEVLYAHCWGGRGRVGLVGACYLAATYKLGADEALERVQRAFDTRKDEQRRSPETDEQHQMVRDFVAGRK